MHLLAEWPVKIIRSGTNNIEVKVPSGTKDKASKSGTVLDIQDIWSLWLLLSLNVGPLRGLMLLLLA